MKKRFSMRNKLLIIFGLLIVLATSVEGLLAIRTARRAVVEKIETHLKDKATDTAEIIDGRINAFFQFLEGIARMKVLQSLEASALQKTQALDKPRKQSRFAAVQTFSLDAFGKKIVRSRTSDKKYAYNKGGHRKRKEDTAIPC